MRWWEAAGFVGAGEVVGVLVLGGMEGRRVHGVGRELLGE